MNKAQANAFAASKGFPGLTVSKAEGVWYLVGDEGVSNEYVERCLHIVRLADLTEDVLSWKIEELTAPRQDDPPTVTLGNRLMPGCTCGAASIGAFDRCWCD